MPECVSLNHMSNAKTDYNVDEIYMESLNHLTLSAARQEDAFSTFLFADSFKRLLKISHMAFRLSRAALTDSGMNQA